MPCGFGHRCPPPSLDSLRVWSLLVDPSFRSLWVWSPLRFHLPWFPVGLVTVAGSPSLVSCGFGHGCPPPFPWFALALVNVAGPPPFVPHGFGHRYQPPSLGAPRAWSTLSAPLPSPRVFYPFADLKGKSHRFQKLKPFCFDFGWISASAFNQFYMICLHVF